LFLGGPPNIVALKSEIKVVAKSVPDAADMKATFPIRLANENKNRDLYFIIFDLYLKKTVVELYQYVVFMQRQVLNAFLCSRVLTA